MMKKLAAFSALGIGGALAWRSVARSQRAFDVTNRVALISGGSRGLGLILARQLADEGCVIALCARSADDLNTARAELEARGATVFTDICDVTDKAQIEATAARVLAHFGHVDILFNVASILQFGPYDTMTDDDYELAMKTNFWSAYHMTQAILLQMRARGEGRIVNISSVGGLIATPHLAPYNAAKFALTGWSTNLRYSVAHDGVFVTTVFPWLMRLGSLRNATFKGKHRAEYAIGAVITGNPIGAMDADKAARCIINAMKRGDASLRLSWRTRFFEILDTLMPELSADALTLADKLLPSAQGEESIGTRGALGYESESKVSRSPLAAGVEIDAEKYNETAMEARGETSDTRGVPQHNST
jgi:NAD(P)-dependent dehydrogenase (short-subunit alcohol dehydrogenase family)